MFIFGHECFWYQHKNDDYAIFQKTNIGYWRVKFSRNIVRDENIRLALEKQGWRVVQIW